MRFFAVLFQNIKITRTLKMSSKHRIFYTLKIQKEKTAKTVDFLSCFYFFEPFLLAIILFNQKKVKIKKK